MSLYWDKFVSSTWPNTGLRPCDDSLSKIHHDLGNTFPAPANGLSGLDLGYGSAAHTLYGTDLTGTALSMDFNTPGAILYARLSMLKGTSNYLQIGFCNSSGTVTDNNAMMIQVDGTITTQGALFDTIQLEAQSLNKLLLNTTGIGTEVEVWCVYRRQVGGKPEIEFWYATAQTGFKPVCFWRYVLLTQNTRYQTWTIRNFDSVAGTAILREFALDTGTAGAVNPLLDPLQSLRGSIAELASLNDMPEFATFAGDSTISGSRGSSYVYDTKRKVDLAICDLQSGDTFFAAACKNVLYANSGGQWSRQLDASGNDLFGNDAAHQRPALFIQGPANSTANLTRVSNTQSQLHLLVGVTNKLTLQSNTTMDAVMASYRGVMGAGNTIIIRDADATNTMPTGANWAAIVWWDSNANLFQCCYLQGGSGVIGAATNNHDGTHTVTATLTGAIYSGGLSALPAAGTPVVVSNNGSLLFTLWSYVLEVDLGSPLVGWSFGVLCEPCVNPRAELPLFTSASCASGLVVMKADCCGSSMVAQTSNGDIHAIGSRRFWTGGGIDYRMARYRKLPHTASDLTGWTAEVPVFQHEIGAVCVKSSGGLTTPLPVDGSYEPLGTFGGYPIYFNYASGLALMVSSVITSDPTWCIYSGINPNAPDDNDATLGWIGPAAADGPYGAFSGGSPGTSTTGNATAVYQPSTTTILGGNEFGDLVAMPDGKLVCGMGGSQLYVLDPNATYLSAETAIPTGTTGTAIYCGAMGTEAAMCLLPDKNIFLIVRNDTAGISQMARVTYSAGRLALDTNKGTSGIVPCDGTSTNPLLIDGKCANGAACFNGKVYVFCIGLPQAGSSLTSRYVMRCYCCPVADAFGGASHGNKWQEASFSPIWNTLDVGFYWPRFAARNNQLVGTFSADASVKFATINTPDAVVSAGGGGGEDFSKSPGSRPQVGGLGSLQQAGMFQ